MFVLFERVFPKILWNPPTEGRSSRVSKLAILERSGSNWIDWTYFRFSAVGGIVFGILGRCLAVGLAVWWQLIGFQWFSGCRENVSKLLIHGSRKICVTRKSIVLGVVKNSVAVVNIVLVDVFISKMSQINVPSYWMDFSSSVRR